MYTDLSKFGACNLKHTTTKHYRTETKPALFKNLRF